MNIHATNPEKRFSSAKMFPFLPSSLGDRLADGSQGLINAYCLHRGSSYCVLPSTHHTHKAQGRPYRLARGDKESTVLPVALIPQLNRVCSDVLDARQSHTFAFSSRYTGLALTIKASYQSRILQRRVGLALPELFLPVAARISESKKRNFVLDDNWWEIKPLTATVPCYRTLLQ